MCSGASSDSMRALLNALEDGLAAIYGTRLKGVYVYGSYALGAQDAESDLDIVVVLEEVERYAAEIDRTGVLVSELSLEYGVSVSRIFVPTREWTDGQSTFLRNVRDEAVPASALLR